MDRTKGTKTSGLRKGGTRKDEPIVEIPMPNVNDFVVLWDNGEERTRWLATIGRSTPLPDRLNALLDMRRKAMIPNLRDSIWGDEEIRAALIELSRGADPNAPQKSMYNEGPEIPDENVRTVVLGIISQLAGSYSACRAMARDAPLLVAILMGTTECDATMASQASKLRKRSWMALTGISLTGACAGKFEDELHKNICCDGLLRGVDSSQTEETRASVLGTLWTMAMSDDIDLGALFKYDNLRLAAIDCAKQHMPQVVRENALGLLWALAVSDSNSKQMWDDESLRDVVLQAVPAFWQPAPAEKGPVDELANALADSGSDDEPEEADVPEPQPQPVNLRIRALHILECWAADPDLRFDMWQCRPLAIAILDASEADEIVEVRAAAVKVLISLAMCYQLQLPMYGADVHVIFAEGSDDDRFSVKLRESCKAAIERLKCGADWAKWELDAARFSDEEATHRL